MAFALQADGWYLRSDIIWHKPAPMPESVTDRPTKAHEYLFLLTKQPRYYYDAEAIKESAIDGNNRGTYLGGTKRLREANVISGGLVPSDRGMGRKKAVSRNRRDVWTIPTQPYKGAHFATFPEKLVEPCILAGTSPKCCGVCGAPWVRVASRGESRDVAPSELDRFGTGETGVHRKVGGQYQKWMDEHPMQTVGWRPTCDHNDDTGSCLVLDPFCGSGTVGAVSRRLGRRFVGVDLSAKYLELARDRIYAVPEGMPL